MVTFFIWLIQIIVDAIFIYILLDSDLRNDIIGKFVNSKKKTESSKIRRKDNEVNKKSTNQSNTDEEIVALIKENTTNNQAFAEKILRQIKSSELQIEKLIQENNHQIPPKETSYIDNGCANDNKSTALNTRKKLFFAFNASNNNPLGFTNDDLSDSDEDRPFVITVSSQNNATYSLVQNKNVLKQLLNTITYYERIIDVEYQAKGEVQRVEILSVGKLALESRMWTIKNKLKIRIV